MAEIIFTYNTIPTVIPCNKNEFMKEICQRFANKVQINISKVYFLYGGQTLDINQTFNNVLKDYDKNSNRINVLVYSYENKNENNNPEISKDIICSKCGNICLINFNKYKINISGCINNHLINDIAFSEFQNFQKIDSSKILCNDCKNNNKRNSYNFYKCLTCKKNLCPLCMNQAHKEHDYIEYDKINYTCNLHNEYFSSYCKKCNRNLCMFCESEHKDKENIIYYRDILPKKDVMKNQKEEIKNVINKFKEKIQEIKIILESIISNLEIYYNINDGLLKNFEKKNRNFQLFKNMNEIINNNFNILKELNVIKNENNKIKFFNYALNIYEQMNNKNINNNLNKISNSIQKENINFGVDGTQEEQKLMKKNSESIKISENKIKNEIKDERNKDILINQGISKNILDKEKTIESNHEKNKSIQEKKFMDKKEILFDKINKNDKNLYFVNASKEMGKYDDMCNFLENEIKKRTSDFNSEERNLISNAYKDLISNPRSSLRIILAYEAKEKKKDHSYYLSYIIEYKKKIFEELKKNCSRVIKIIDEYLLKKAKDDEAIVFYYKMKGDYDRFIAESSEGNIKIQAEDSASKAYTEAIKRTSKLYILNPVRLELYLNYSIFLYEVLNDRIKAIDIAKKVISEADRELPNIDEDADENKDTVSLYYLLKENVECWESEEYED